jgi:hypothetical protein
MKNNKLLIVILVLALLAAYIFIGSDYLKQRRNNASLTVQVTAAEAALAQIPVSPNDLAQRLAAAEDDLKNAESVFSADMNDTRIVNTILRVAEKIGVKAVPLNTSPWAIQEVAGRQYNVFRLELEVTGTFNQLLTWLNRMENGEPETLVIEYLNVENTADSSANISDTGATPVKASIKLAIYALPPVTG